MQVAGDGVGEKKTGREEKKKRKREGKKTTENKRKQHNPHQKKKHNQNKKAGKNTENNKKQKLCNVLYIPGSHQRPPQKTTKTKETRIVTYKISIEQLGGLPSFLLCIGDCTLTFLLRHH
jgi:hypothetical protein